jgi:hypothetical protein
MANEKSPVSVEMLDDGATLVEDARGSARLYRLGPGALLYVCTGHLAGGFYVPMVEVANREMAASGRVVMFVDGWELRSVDTEFREAWTLWFKGHRKSFHMRLLVRTKLMDMAASLANLFSGMTVIKTYSNIGAWERACATDFRGFRSRPRAAS